MFIEEEDVSLRKLAYLFVDGPYIILAEQKEER